MMPFEPANFRQHFPLINTLSEQGNIVKQATVMHQPIVYFDNAATTQKPNKVIDSYRHYYQTSNANVHRSSHQLSTKATQAFEAAREQVKELLHAKSSKEIIWTKGTTESINLVAQCLGRKVLGRGDEIVLSQSEHHANIVPWQVVAEQTGALIRVLPLTRTGVIDCSKLTDVINDHTKIVACAHISNVIGKINPIEVLIARAKEVGAITLIDGAQAMAHLSVNVQQLDCDFYVFSAHKMYGPTGVGVLYGKEHLLESMPVYQAGGEMIKQVSFTEATTFAPLPFKFEAGTPNIAGVIAFAQAIAFIKQFDLYAMQHYERSLIEYCFQALQKITEVDFIVDEKPDIPVISFTLKGHHNHDVATTLDSYGIAIRGGHHCAMPLMRYLSINGCLRMSLAHYNTFSEINFFINTLKNIINNTMNVNKTTEQKGEEQDVKGESSQAIVTNFSQLKGWHARHREIMLLGKKLKRLSPSLRSECSLISGCESLAWLIAEKNEQGVFHFQADSDAKIIRGLLVIILAAFNNKTATEINRFDIDGYFSTLGLMQQLSPSRGNGVRAIVDKVLAITTIT